MQKQIVIRAPVQDVWRAWTTEEGLAAVSPRSRIDLRAGGDYGWFLQLPPDARHLYVDFVSLHRLPEGWRVVEPG